MLTAVENAPRGVRVRWSRPVGSTRTSVDPGTYAPGRTPPGRLVKHRALPSPREGPSLSRPVSRSREGAFESRADPRRRFLGLSAGFAGTDVGSGSGSGVRRPAVLTPPSALDLRSIDPVPLDPNRPSRSPRGQLESQLDSPRAGAESRAWRTCEHEDSDTRRPLSLPPLR